MEENHQSDIDFIRTDLLPEMVHNRCFCDADSREFVEFDSATVHPSISRKSNSTRKLYKAQVVIRFSGQPVTFSVIIKLLSIDWLEHDASFGRFLNEEMFYNKMTNKWKLDIYPKCYVADMGRYGRPVVVLEDLETLGYRFIDSKVDEDHLTLLIKAIATFHGRGFKIKQNEFSILREFYAKLVTPNANDDDIQSISRDFTKLRDNLSTDLEKLWSEKNAESSLIGEEDFTIICHGNFDEHHWLFKYENDKPIAVKIIGWNEMRYTNLLIDLNFILDASVNSSYTKKTQLLHEYFRVLTAEYDDQLHQKLYRRFLLTYFYPQKISSLQSHDNEVELLNLLSELS